MSRRQKPPEIDPVDRPACRPDQRASTPVTGRGHGEDAAAVGNQATDVIQRRAGLEDIAPRPSAR